jgi:hypothetical protein
MSELITIEPIHQFDLFADMNEGIYRKFQQFHKEFPQVYLLFKKFALLLIEAGNKKLGSKMIIERIRWEYKTGSKDTEGFKINNNFTAHYARMFIKEYPQYGEYFEFRELKSI